MKYYLLESGSKGNCFVLQEGKRTIVIDCGGTSKYLKDSFKKLNISFSDVDVLLISHTHIDHISQLSLFKNNLVYSPVKLEKRTDAKIMKPLGYFMVDNIKVTPIPLSHDTSITLGFIFETKKEKLVYITDTGYLNKNYINRLKGADYIILESNHDVEMLMSSSRPHHIKQRIFSDTGHLCNEDCALILEKIVSENTKDILLAHISLEANTYEKALEVNVNHLINSGCLLNKDLRIVAAKQFEIVAGGKLYEENNSYNYNSNVNLEWLFNTQFK